MGNLQSMGFGAAQSDRNLTLAGLVLLLFFAPLAQPTSCALPSYTSWDHSITWGGRSPPTAGANVVMASPVMVNSKEKAGTVLVSAGSTLFIGAGASLEIFTDSCN